MNWTFLKEGEKVKRWEGDKGDTFPLSHLLTLSLSQDKKEPFYGRVEYKPSLYRTTP
jgi:hypothetical protein